MENDVSPGQVLDDTLHNKPPGGGHTAPDQAQRRNAPTDPHPRFLGIVFDRLLSFTGHAKQVAGRARTRCGILSALSGAKWGPKFAELRALYLTYIKPVLEYAGGAWMPGACDTAIEHLDRAQRKAARIVTGCTINTKCEIVEREAQLVPMKERAIQLGTELRERALRLPSDNPLKDAATGKAHRKRNGQLRLTSVRSWREAAEIRAEQLELEEWPRDKLTPSPAIPAWELVDSRDGNTVIGLTLSKETRRTDRPELRQEAAMGTLDTLPEANTVIWTDGAAEAGVYNGGSGVLIYTAGTRTEIALPAGRHTSSYRAELTAMEAALSLSVQWQLAEPIRICTDSLSALQSLDSGPAGVTDPVLKSIWRHIHMLESADTNLVLQWVPGHAGVEGNEEVDGAAKRGCDEDQLLAPVSLNAARKFIGREAKKSADRKYQELLATSRSVQWHHAATSGKQPTPPPDSLTRSHQRVFTQLRAGSSPLTEAYLFDIKKKDSPTCLACGDAPETARHLLLECAQWTAPRTSIWGPFPSIEAIFCEPKQLILFLVRIGRISDHDMGPHGPNAHN